MQSIVNDIVLFIDDFHLMSELPMFHNCSMKLPGGGAGGKYDLCGSLIEDRDCQFQRLKISLNR